MPLSALIIYNSNALAKPTVAARYTPIIVATTVNRCPIQYVGFFRLLLINTSPLSPSPPLEKSMFKKRVSMTIDTLFNEPKVGIEPTTYALRERCSTPELLWQLRYVQ